MLVHTDRPNWSLREFRCGARTPPKTGRCRHGREPRAGGRLPPTRPQAAGQTPRARGHFAPAQVAVCGPTLLCLLVVLTVGIVGPFWKMERVQKRNRQKLRIRLSLRYTCKMTHSPNSTLNASVSSKKFQVSYIPSTVS